MKEPKSEADGAACGAASIVVGIITGLIFGKIAITAGIFNLAGLFLGMVAGDKI
jgi:F0F1-type ATP synthase assembly protein I